MCKIFLLLTYIFAMRESYAENDLLMLLLKMSRDFVARNSYERSFRKVAPPGTEASRHVVSSGFR